jgi:signal transduction histidine kinase/CheY-like chemotaxis protein
MSSESDEQARQAGENPEQKHEKRFRGDMPDTTVPKLNVCLHHGSPRCIVPEAIEKQAASKEEKRTGNPEEGNGHSQPHVPRTRQSNDAIRVLLIAENADRIQLVASALAKAPAREFKLTSRGCMGDANRELKDRHHDIVLIDFHGAEERACLQPNVISYLRRRHSEIPVAALSDAPALDAILRGAQDCISTGQIEPDSLERIIEHAVLRDDLTQQLRHANRLLDKKGGELRRANDLLRQKNGRLKRLYDMAQEFVDHVSHEFRTPLTVIKEYASILGEGLVGPVSSKQREFLEIIDSRTDDLAYLIDDLLDVSRLRAGMIGVYRRDCTAAEIFERVRSVLEPKVAKRGISLDFRVEGTLPRVYCDPEKIGRAIVNLVVNAANACESGQAIDVCARAGETAGEIVVGVTDNGPGIASKDRQRIFERFCQAKGDSNGQGDGFGLGLSIVRDLVSLNFGELHLDSVLGKGTTFSFSLPCSNMKGLVTRYIRALENLAETPIPVSVLNLEAVTSDDRGYLDGLDRFLQSQTRRHDFVLRVAGNKWLVFVQCCDSEVDQVVRRWREAWDEIRGEGTEAKAREFEFERRGTWTLPEESTDLVQELRPDYLTSAQHSNGTCVLVVDDDRDFAAGLNLQLGAAGYAAKTAKDAETALRMAVQLHPTAILLDNSLPGMNGIEALEELKRNPATQDIPVIMLSANTKLQQAALAHDAKFYLKKPCGFDKIATALRHILA